MNHRTADRKRLWRNLQPRLRGQRDLEALEKYFWTGSPEPKDLVLRLYLHPEGEAAWPRILADATYAAFIEGRRTYLSWSRRTGDALLAGFTGTEARLARVFFPATDASATFRFGASEIPAIDTRTPQGFSEGWLRSTGMWLTAAVPNPCANVQYQFELAWSAIRLAGDGFCKEELIPLLQCAHYVEASAMPGADTPQRRFVQRMREELAKDDLPPGLKALWNKLQSRAGRTEAWLGNVSSAEDGPEDWGSCPDYEWQVALGEGRGDRLMGPVVDTLRGLGFTTDHFDAERIEAVNLREHMSREFKALLGYSPRGNSNVPGYRFRVHTTPEFTDSDTIRIDLDVIVPLPGPKAEARRPLLVLVPRPAARYPWGNLYDLNLRMLRRCIEAETGQAMTFFRDRGPESYFYIGPFEQATFTPSAKGFAPYLPEEDFPAWSGKLPAKWGEP